MKSIHRRRVCGKRCLRWLVGGVTGVVLLGAGGWGLQQLRAGGNAPAAPADLAWDEFRQAIEQKIDRARTLVDRASDFDQTQALAAARSGTPNGFTFRFLDHLGLREPGEADPEDADPEDAAPEAKYRLLGREGRPAFELKPGEAYRWPVELPGEPLEMMFGLGSEKGKPAGSLEIVFRFGNREETVGRFDPKWVKGWHPIRFVVPTWAVGTGQIEWKLSAADEKSVFVGDPVIFGRPERRLNVVLILEDTLRADHLSGYGYHRLTSPVKDAFFGEGVVFNHAFSQGPTTLVSCPALMTSLYPSATGVVSHDVQLPDAALTLAEILRDQGFATGAILQNGYGGKMTGLHQGYERILEPKKGKGWPTSESVYTSAAPEWLDAFSGRNTFLYLHIFDPHHPYMPHDEFTFTGAALREESVRRADPIAMEGQPPVFDRTDWDQRRFSYGGEIRRNDFYFGEFVDELKKRDLLDHTLFIFVSDHGEYFGERGRWLHTSPGFIQVTHVPLMMRHPTLVPSGVRYDPPVQLVDVVPTILDLLEIPKAPFLLSGDSLVPLMRNEPGTIENFAQRVNFSEENDKEGGSFIRGPWHILSSRGFLRNMEGHVTKGAGPPLPVRTWKRWRLAGEQIRVFNYRDNPTEAGPDAALNHDADFHAEVMRLRDALREEYAAVHALLAREGSDDYEFDPETIEKLKDLGYL